MRRARRRPQNRRGLRAGWLALLAVAGLLFAPVLVNPAHAHGAASAPRTGCGMDAVPTTSPERPRDRGAACAAACAVCAHVAPAREEAAPAPPSRSPARVLYPGAELRPAGTEPEVGDPPPR